MNRRWAILWMAVWLTGTLWMALVATQNFLTIDRLLSVGPNPAFTSAVEKLGEEQARLLLRYLSSELNRLFFQVWGLLQIGVGILALAFVVRLPKSATPKWMIVSMLGISLLLAAIITPQIVVVGRSLDFVPRDPAPSSLRTFGLLHAVYTVLDGIMLILGILVTWWLLKEPASSPAAASPRS